MQCTQLEVSFLTSLTTSETAVAFPFSDPLAPWGAGSPHFQAALTVLGAFFSQSGFVGCTSSCWIIICNALCIGKGSNVHSNVPRSYQWDTEAFVMLGYLSKRNQLLSITFAEHSHHGSELPQLAKVLPLLPLLRVGDMSSCHAGLAFWWHWSFFFFWHICLHSQLILDFWRWGHFHSEPLFIFGRY